MANKEPTPARYSYQVKKIKHVPDDEAAINDVTEIKKDNLAEARREALRQYREEEAALDGKYSPESYRTYDPEKGEGYNVVLLLVDEKEEMGLVIASSFYDNDKVIHDREVEKKIYMQLGLDLPENPDGLS